jgi:hypothetical protein
MFGAVIALVVGLLSLRSWLLGRVWGIFVMFVVGTWATWLLPLGGPPYPNAGQWFFACMIGVAVAFLPKSIIWGAGPEIIPPMERRPFPADWRR